MFQITSYLVNKLRGRLIKMGGGSMTDQSVYELPSGLKVKVDSYGWWEFNGLTGQGFQSLKNAVDGEDRAGVMREYHAREAVEQSARAKEQAKKEETRRKFEAQAGELWAGSVRAIQGDAGSLEIKQRGGDVEAKAGEFKAYLDKDGRVEVWTQGKVFKGPTAWTKARESMKKYGVWE